MNEQPIENPAQAEAVPPEQAQQPGNQQSGDVELIKQALLIIYEDQKAYGALLNLLEQGKANIIIATSKAAVTVMQKLKEDRGQLAFEEVKQVLPMLVGAIMELAETAGVVPEITGDMIKSAAGLTFKEWAEKNPDSVDSEAMQGVMGSPQGQQALQSVQGQQPPQQTEEGMLP